MQNIKRWISLALVVCLLAISPAAALAEGTSAGTGLPAEGESITSPQPVCEHGGGGRNDCFPQSVHRSESFPQSVGGNQLCAHGRGGGQDHYFLRGRCPGGTFRAAGNA